MTFHCRARRITLLKIEIYHFYCCCCNSNLFCVLAEDSIKCSFSTLEIFSIHIRAFSMHSASHILYATHHFYYYFQTFNSHFVVAVKCTLLQTKYSFFFLYGWSICYFYCSFECNRHDQNIKKIPTCLFLYCARTHVSSTSTVAMLSLRCDLIEVHQHFSSNIVIFIVCLIAIAKWYLPHFLCVELFSTIHCSNTIRMLFSIIDCASESTANIKDQYIWTSSWLKSFFWTFETDLCWFFSMKVKISTHIKLSLNLLAVAMG